MPLDFNQPPVSQLSFNDSPPVTVPDAVADTRAQKFNIAMGGNQDTDQLKATIASGNEDQIRDQMSVQQSLAQQDLKLQMINQVAKTTNGPLTQDQFNYMMNLTPDQVQHPETIMETELAKKVFSNLFFTNTEPDAPTVNALQDSPEKANPILDVAQDYMAKTEIAKKLYSDIETQKVQIHNNPLDDFITGQNSFIGQWIPFHKNIQLGTFGFALGSDVADEYRKFRAMTPDDFQKEFSAKVNQIALQSPEAAQEYISNYFNDSSGNEFWGNMGELMDIGSLVPVGAAGKAAKGAVDATEGAGAATKIPFATKGVSPELQSILDTLKATKPSDTDTVASTITKQQQVNDLKAQLDAKYPLGKTPEEVSPQPKDPTDIQGLLDSTRPQERFNPDTGQFESAETPETLAKKQKITSDLQTMLNTAREVNKAAESDSVSKVLAAAGKTDDAARVEALKAQVTEGTREDVVRNLPDAYDPNAQVRRPFTIAQGRTTELAEATKADEIQSVIDDLTQKVNGIKSTDFGLERLPVQAAVAGQRLAEKKLAQELNINNSIAQVKFRNVEAQNAHSNTYSIVAQITKPNGSLFPNSGTAGKFAQNILKLGKGDYKIVPQGEGHLIEVTRPYDETAGGVRAMLIPTGNATPVRWWSRAGAIRGAAEILSPQQMAVRTTAEIKVRNLQHAFIDLLKPIGELPKASQESFNRVLTSLRDSARVKGQNYIGGYVRTPQDLAREWMGVTGKYPTAAETKAYFSYKSAYDSVHAARNYAAYRSLARQGMTELNVQGIGFYGKLLERDASVFDKPFNGAIVIEPNGSKTYFSFNSPQAKLAREGIEAKLKEGWSIIQVGSPYDRPLADVDGRVINYVITNKFRNRPLPDNIVPYNPAGFTEYSYQYKIAQPRLSEIEGRNLYMGDQLISTAETAKDAAYRAGEFENMRLAYKDHDYAGLDQIAHGLGLDPMDIREAFGNGTLDANHPITFTKFGQDTIDKPELTAQLSHFKDTRNDPLDLVKGVDKSALEKAAFPLDTQKILDPTSTVKRATDRIGRNAYMQDYQILSAEQFGQEFWDVLNVPKQMLQSNPMPYMMEAEKYIAKGADPNKVAAMMNFRNSVRNLVGVQTSLQKDLNLMMGKVHEATYGKYGEKAIDVASTWALSTAADVPSLARRFVNDIKLSFLNIGIFVRQLQQYTVAAPIIGVKKSFQSVGAQILQAMHMFNPKFLDDFDAHATTLGWKRGDFKTLQNFIDETGFLNSRADHAYNLDDALDPKLIQTPLGQALDASKLPFYAGEGATRQFSLNGAFLEWREANPTAVFDRRAQYSVLSRARQLNGNMDRASLSNIQTNPGYGSDVIVKTATQFGNYTMRLQEMLTGKQLTRFEKAKVIGALSIMYGVPGAASAVVPWPWYDEIRKNMIKNGQTWINGVDEAVFKGLPEVFLHMITGREYDVAGALGPGPYSIFQDKSGSSLQDMLLGASGSTLLSIGQTTYPLLKSLAEIVQPGGKSVVAQDFLDAMKNISSVNSASKLYYALQYQKAVTNNEVTLANDLTPMDGVLLALGIQPQELEDIGTLASISKQEAGAKKYAHDQIVKYTRQYVQAGDVDDKASNLRMANNWGIWGGLQPDEIVDAIHDAETDYESLFDQMNEELMLKNVPENLKQQRRSLYDQGYDKQGD